MKKYKTHDAEFKRDAVRLLINSGRALGDVAEELGVERSCLGRWKKRYLEELDKNGSPKGITASDLERENIRLRKELSQVKEQRDILKKACGILSDRPGRSMP